MSTFDWDKADDEQRREQIALRLGWRFIPVNDYWLLVPPDQHKGYSSENARAEVAEQMRQLKRLNRAKNYVVHSLGTRAGRESRGMTPYEAGYDCGKNGANQTNCDFRLFAKKEWTWAWELGKKDAEAGRPMRKAVKG